jgi:hypothetical protein
VSSNPISFAYQFTKGDLDPWLPNNVTCDVAAVDTDPRDAAPRDTECRWCLNVFDAVVDAVTAAIARMDAMNPHSLEGDSRSIERSRGRRVLPPRDDPHRGVDKADVTPLASPRHSSPRVDTHPPRAISAHHHVRDTLLDVARVARDASGARARDQGV